VSTISDGAPSQHKLSTHALWVSSHKARTGVQADWCFRGTAHGKDEVDGACGDCKNAVQREQLRADRGARLSLGVWAGGACMLHGGAFRGKFSDFQRFSGFC